MTFYQHVHYCKTCIRKVETEGQICRVSKRLRKKYSIVQQCSNCGKQTRAGWYVRLTLDQSRNATKMHSEEGEVKG